MRLLNASLRSAALRAGGLRILRTVSRPGARIIVYHRFPESCQASLRRQCAYLRKCYRIVRLDDIRASLNGGLPLDRNALAVTVDDGYRDFFQVAYPIFHEFRIPVTVFLTTGFLDGQCWLWCDLVGWLFRHSPLDAVELRCGERDYRLPLNSEAERSHAAAVIKDAAKQLDQDLRARFLAELPAWLRVAPPEVPPPSHQPLLWDEVRRMQRDGISFGAHTVTHPILSSIHSEEHLQNEIAGSRRRIQQETGGLVLHFAYPNGTLRDVNPAVVRVVAAAGFASGCLADFGVNPSSAHPYLLQRNPVEAVTAVEMFGRYVLR